MKEPIPGKDTRSALLDTAEALFLEKGFDAVSIRQITEAAGANVAAINYHFNGKVNLYREVLGRCFAEVVNKKVEQINNIDQRGGGVSLHDLVKRYIRSHFDEILANPDGEKLLQIVFHEMSPDAVASDLVASELIFPIHQALHRSISQIRPDLSGPFISRCISSITGQVLHYIRFRDVIKGYSGIQSDREFIEEMTQHITRFSLQGIGSENHATQ